MINRKPFSVHKCYKKPYNTSRSKRGKNGYKIGVLFDTGARYTIITRKLLRNRSLIIKQFDKLQFISRRGGRQESEVLEVIIPLVNNNIEYTICGTVEAESASTYQ